MKFITISFLILSCCFACQPSKNEACIQDFLIQLPVLLENEQSDISTLHCFPWDTLMVLAPYHYCEQIREETGILIPADLANFNSEDVFILGIQNNQVRKLIRVPKEQANLIDIIRKRALSRSYIVLRKQESLVLEL